MRPGGGRSAAPFPVSAPGRPLRIQTPPAARGPAVRAPCPAAILGASLAPLHRCGRPQTPGLGRQSLQKLCKQKAGSPPGVGGSGSEIGGEEGRRVLAPGGGWRASQGRVSSARPSRGHLGFGGSPRSAERARPTKIERQAHVCQPERFPLAGLPGYFIHQPEVGEPDAASPSADSRDACRVVAGRAEPLARLLDPQLPHL